MKVKMIFLGASGVGKTAIVSRYRDNSFTDAVPATIGIDYEMMRESTEVGEIDLLVYDTGGQEKYNSIMPAYIKESTVAVVVYDVTNEDTFKTVRQHVETVIEENKGETFIVICGNKIDLLEEGNTEPSNQITEYVEENRFMHRRVSAKTGEGVLEMMKAIVNEVAPRIKEKPRPVETSLKLEQEEEDSCYCF